MDIIQNLATETIADEGHRKAILGLLGRVSNLADARYEFIHLSVVSKRTTLSTYSHEQERPRSPRKNPC
jgi:hypothetical protein